MSKSYFKWTMSNTVDILMIALGSAIYAFSVDLVSIPNKLADGGLSGFTLIIRHFWGINPGISTFIINIPLIILGFKYMGKRAMLYTVWGTLCLSLFLNAWSLQSIIKQVPLHHDPFLATVTAGCLSGLGLGLVFRFNGTTGGSDIVARVVQEKYGIAPSSGLLMLDFLALACSLSYLDFFHVGYTMVSCYILSKVLGLVTEGGTRARGVFIISQKYREIATLIDLKLERGFTYINAEGGYSSDPQHMIYLVLSPREIPKLKKLVKAEDPKAFITFFEANEAIGEGFSYKTKHANFFIRK
ncbi:membrane protein [Lactobacillus nasalidis]|uniref:Membrane protein n=1 Tax=Lactobacillus nasalidis TaxID=2797258 RepID=A0ABQ3W6G2_9LACO|nr:YitT family protein [Lactobacillus nasalidis]GHV97576.1 membrane protein [Lactobacillus nasalidis]GHV99527.1 membrane protein [Lactobacillus nasalidis]GHW01101.1 membrane protein [Lactobacillus nasalidis]